MNKNINYADFLFYHIEKSDLLTGFVIGHLVLENLMKGMIAAYDPNLEFHVAKLSHAKIINLCNELKLLSADQKTALGAINKMRNNFAHDLGYAPVPNELKNLFILAKKGFSDMTDGLEQGIDALTDKNWRHKGEGGEYTLSDLFIQIAFDMDHMTEALGKDGWLSNSG